MPSDEKFSRQTRLARLGQCLLPSPETHCLATFSHTDGAFPHPPCPAKVTTFRWKQQKPLPWLLGPMCPFQKRCVSLESHFGSFWHIPALPVSQQQGSRRWRGGVQRHPSSAWQPAPEHSASHNLPSPACEQLPLVLCGESPSWHSCPFRGRVKRSLPPGASVHPFGVSWDAG